MKISIKTDGYCAICGYKIHMVIHHIEYIPDEITIPVCKKCHSAIHNSKTYPYLEPKVIPNTIIKSRISNKEWYFNHFISPRIEKWRKENIHR